jgi:hypothetical protein
MVELIKMEFKSCYQRIGIALLASMAIGCMSILTNNGIIGGNFAISAMIIWSFAIIGVICVFVYNVVTSFSRRLFSHEGYLSLTLPVSSKQLVLAKYIVQLIWLFFIFLASLILVALFTLSAGRPFSEALQILGEMMKFLFGYVDGLLTVFYMVSYVTFGVMSAWFFLTWMHTKVLRSKRVLAAVIFWYIFNSLFSLVMTQVFKAVYGYSYYFLDTVILLFSGIIYLVFAVLFFMGITYLLDYHIELE